MRNVEVCASHFFSAEYHSGLFSEEDIFSNKTSLSKLIRNGIFSEFSPCLYFDIFSSSLGVLYYSDHVHYILFHVFVSLSCVLYE